MQGALSFQRHSLSQFSVMAFVKFSPWIPTTGSSRSSRGPICQRRAQRLPVACSSNGAEKSSSLKDVEESELHDSWRVYDQGESCVVCLGKGETKCLYCYGTGVVIIGPEKGRDTQTCTHCNGKKVETCCRCEGTGIRPSTKYDFEAQKQVPNKRNADFRMGTPLKLDEMEPEDVASSVP